MAKAFIILWALQLAKLEKLQNITMEDDAKACFYAFKYEYDYVVLSLSLSL